MKSFIDILKEDENQKITFVVVLKGGSIGEKTIRDLRSLKNTKLNKSIFKDIFSTKDEAKLKAKSLNKQLSPGEKKYYGMKYIVAAVENNVFTGK